MKRRTGAIGYGLRPSELIAPGVHVCFARVRRGSVIQLAAIGLVAGAVGTAVALLIPWLPTSAGKEAHRIHFVYWFTTAIAIAVFSVVARGSHLLDLEVPRRA